MLSSLISKLEAIKVNLMCNFPITTKCRIKNPFQARNPLISDVQNNQSVNSSKKIDSVIDSSITILSIAQDACVFIPPAFVKTCVTLACDLVKAVKVRASYL